MKKIRKVALAIFKDKKLLCVRSAKNREVFYSLGGTLEEGESEIGSLVREVKEEIDCDLVVDTLEFLAEFEDLAHGKDDTVVNIRMYKGDVKGVPKPLHEVVEIGYFDSTTPHRFLSKIAIEQMFPLLKKRGYIS